MNEKPEPKLDINGIPWRALYPSDEARVLLGDISEPTFRRLTKAGTLQTKKMGRRVYVTSDAIKAYIDSLPNATAA